MNILSYLREKRRERKALSEHLSRLKQSGLRFPIFCKLHAVKSHDHQGAIAQSREGDNLQIVHVPSDSRLFNVCVYSIPLNRVLGYVETELSERLVNLFGRGFCVDGEIENVTGGPPYKYYGCNIRILDTREFMNEYEDFSSLRGE